MKNLKIKIHGLNDMNDFIQRAQRTVGDVLVKRGKYCVDGRSALGVMSIGVDQGITVEIEDSEANATFIEWLSKFVV